MSDLDSSTAPGAGSGAGVRLSTAAFAVLVGLVALPWALVATGVIGSPSAGSAPAATAKPVATKGSQVRSGPWGILELTRITISPSEELIPAGWSKQLTATWFFSGHNEESLRQFLGTLNLTDAQSKALLNVETWAVEQDGITIRPDGDTVMSLDPGVRAALYGALARSDRNLPHHQPWSIRTEDFEAALAASGLSAETQALIRKVVYIRGPRSFVSDSFTILNMTQDRDEKLRITRLLSSASTYLVNLRITPDTNIDRLVAYWGGRGRRKDLRPMLESLTGLPGGGTLDIAHLLPAFARQRIYIYPHPAQAADGVRRDCHWTSLNFFSLTPEDRFGISEEAQRHIIEHYYGIGETPQFGDVLFLSLPSGEVIHSCVYLAANLVFTKNGDSVRQPWSIMDLDDVTDLYAVLSPEGVNVQYWRNRDHEN
ncbi:MAG: hypothetical protein FJ221_04960 [Lentisphaerae bacterium]|nr:hypothetical protein [Lentisphaerota bacterium]